MKKLLASLFAASLMTAAYASCMTQTVYTPDGNMRICTTCCYGEGNCTTTCY